MSEQNMVETQQYLSFKLGDEVYAIDIGRIREVLEMTKVTKVPRTPDFMRGIINLRGGVVPVIDMRLKFGMSATEQSVDTCIIILEIAIDHETTVLGAIADSVQEVFELDASQIEPAPRIGTRLKTAFIHGMGKRNDEFVIILDIDQVFSADELQLVQSAGQQPVAMP